MKKPKVERHHLSTIEDALNWKWYVFFEREGAVHLIPLPMGVPITLLGLSKQVDLDTGETVVLHTTTAGLLRSSGEKVSEDALVDFLEVVLAGKEPEARQTNPDDPPTQVLRFPVPRPRK